MVSIAKEAGFEITAEEVKEAQAQLSDAEKNLGAAGGVTAGPWPDGDLPSCVCFRIF
ncbi:MULTISPECIES: hypothetical protein [Prochlorococcus]|uniref:hypothetical protein n=1 Tax=Prochlorococcus TaxID=1218 RepID=UPI001F24B7BB|nr:hypothetical protein [Prochlorococcus marinus]